ncbi:MAG TPA: carboxypeptidase-like regulatory domain-containing protein, partial [Kofleriaceae bacterium]|nr:carboxypeptidase-like regulatory domain-containing protein [Kofleriaceae bacterium]
GDGPDGGAGGGPSPDPAGGGGADGAPIDIACDEPVDTGESGKHNAGRACLECHGNGEGPSFELAGTVYTTLAGGAPVAGATIRVLDADGVEHTAISARNGNFWLREAIAFPVQVQASSCPSTQPMIAPSATGNCNAAGCHDADFRIHLP